MQANASVSRLHTHFLTTGLPLSNADAVEILGGVYFALCGQICCSLSDMHANHAAQGAVLRLRYQLWRETYGGAR